LRQNKESDNLNLRPPTSPTTLVAISRTSYVLFFRPASSLYCSVNTYILFSLQFGATSDGVSSLVIPLSPTPILLLEAVQSRRWLERCFRWAQSS
jgi:hypothetical protein